MYIGIKIKISMAMVLVFISTVSFYAPDISADNGPIPMDTSEDKPALVVRIVAAIGDRPGVVRVFHEYGPEGHLLRVRRELFGGGVEITNF